MRLVHRRTDRVADLQSQLTVSAVTLAALLTPPYSKPDADLTDSPIVYSLESTSALRVDIAAPLRLLRAEWLETLRDVDATNSDLVEDAIASWIPGPAKREMQVEVELSYGGRGGPVVQLDDLEDLA
jgi:hypothetical protein